MYRAQGYLGVSKCFFLQRFKMCFLVLVSVVGFRV